MTQLAAEAKERDVNFAVCMMMIMKWNFLYWIFFTCNILYFQDSKKSINLHQILMQLEEMKMKHESAVKDSEIFERKCKSLEDKVIIKCVTSW